jgi:hypothetical protein
MYPIGIQVGTISGLQTPERQSDYCGVRMKMSRWTAAAIVASSGIVASIAIASEEPPVKKSKSGICHARGTSFYAQTKNYTAFNSLEECLKSGGRAPKR